MFDIQMVLVLVLGAIMFVGVVVLFVSSLYRSRMAPLVREAMNAAYQDVEFHKINLIPERCDGEALLRFAAA